MKMAEDVLINSTPTLFINGEKDTTRVKYKDLVK
jgi:protein-disulfide isomerase